VKLLRREKSWIHTFFVTDCTYLPDEGAREIRRAMGLVLEERRIVFGLHFTSWGSEPGLIICLECLPFPETLEAIEKELVHTIAPFPSHPRATKVEIEPPAKRLTTARR
jgi:hypothetical protein